MVVGGLGDDLIKRYWGWRTKAHKNLQASSGAMASPYSNDFADNQHQPVPSSIATGTSFGDDPSLVSKVRSDARLRNTPLVNDAGHIDGAGNVIGTYGIKEDYLQETPAASFPPMNYKQYSKLLVYDNIVKDIFQKEEECPVYPNRPPPPPSTTDKTKKEPEVDLSPVGAGTVFAASQKNATMVA